MKSELDHLVVGARTLDEGAAWVESRLGAAPVPGGKHPLMGTHNRLLFTGPGTFLEVIAIDPEAPAPARARWFDLDDPAVGASLAASPALIHWVHRTGDIDAALLEYPERVEVLDLARGDYRWRIGVRADGRRPGEGTLPTLIQWQGRHPADSLPDSGIRLQGLSHEGGRLQAVFVTPGGKRTIP